MSDYSIRFLPDDVRQDALEGASLLEIARRAGYVLRSECGGQGTCRRCKVRLRRGDVFLTAEPNLTVSEKEQGFTLACLARISGDLDVEIPESSELTFAPGEAGVEMTPGEHPGTEIQALGYALEPLVQRVKLNVPPASLDNNTADFERLCAALHQAGIGGLYHADLCVLRKLADELRTKAGAIEIALRSDTPATVIVDILADDIPLYGVALDIGTTTVFARLLDLRSGEVVAEASEFNGQIPCGGDIIHRIVYAHRRGGLEELQQLALKTVNGLIADLLTDAERSPEQVVACSTAGNTTMQHLLLGLNPKYIREEPYVPGITRFPILYAAEVGLNILPNAPVYLAPSVGSYVGGDITAGLLAAGVHRSDRLTLYVDLGTNGEVALGNREWLTACACSAGPAFEGGGVKCGMRALPGGIDRITSDADDATLSLRTIGGGTPRGICGSGMVDLLAELRATGRITARGKLNGNVDPQRIRRSGRKAEIVLIRGESQDGSADIVVTEPDLDNLIRTKGAIFAGIMTLCKGVGIEVSEIERVVIAGAFGRYLDIGNAVRIGMLPDLPRERFEYIGNGSLRGAGLALLSKTMWREMHAIADQITYFELSAWPGYMDEFMASLFLPHTDRSLFPSVERSSG